MKRDRPIILDGDADGPGAELEALFGRLREQGPDAEATRRATDRAREVLASDAAARPLARGVVGWRPLAAAAGVLLGVVVWFSLLGGELATPVWADVVKQSAGFKTASLVVREYEQERLVGRDDVYVQKLATIRVHTYEVVEGVARRRGGSVATPDEAVRWDARSGVSERMSTDNPYVAQAEGAESMLAFLGVAVWGKELDAPMTVNGQSVRFEAVEERHPADAALRGYRLRGEDAALVEGGRLAQTTYWFAGTQNEVQRLTVRRGAARPGVWADVEVAFDADLPAGFFAVKAPDEFGEVADGVRGRLSDDVAVVYDAVAAARARFGDYRAVIWRDHTAGWPWMRESRRGGAWRVDRLDWTVMHGGAYADALPAGLKPATDESIGAAWPRVVRAEYKVEQSAFRSGAGYALIHFDLSGRGPRVSTGKLPDLKSGGRDRYWGMALRRMAWPEWEANENLHPHGRDLREPMLTYRRLPDDPEQPGLIEIVGERESRFGVNYVRYTLDAERDYLCVRRAWYEGSSNGLVWRALELGQTEAGRWYPKRVGMAYSGQDRQGLGEEPKTWDQQYGYVVGEGAAEVGFFAWPEGAPDPVDPFASLKSRELSRTPDSAPPTARGKYVAGGTNGYSQRGFDDRASLDRHQAMLEVASGIRSAIKAYREAHDWRMPDSLSDLVGEYLEPADLKNPTSPEAESGFVYLKPERRWPNPGGRVLLYEPFTEWPGVTTVFFGDGSVEYIHDEATFNRLLAEARSPEDPSRRGE